MLVKIYTDGAARGNPDGPGGISAPVKYGFNGAIPELINNKLLSFTGTREKLFIAK